MKDVFVFTDDYAAIQNLQTCYPDYNIYTLATPADKGYNHMQFKRKSAEERLDGSLKMLASIEIMAKAEIFIGSMTTNPGMFLGMYMPKDKVVYVDSERWEIL